MFIVKMALNKQTITRVPFFQTPYRY